MSLRRGHVSIIDKIAEINWFIVLLMTGIVGAAHIGKHKKKSLHRFLQTYPNLN